jgi:hypothetical protein
MPGFWLGTQTHAPPSTTTAPVAISTGTASTSSPLRRRGLGGHHASAPPRPTRFLPSDGQSPRATTGERLHDPLKGSNERGRCLGRLAASKIATYGERASGAWSGTASLRHRRCPRATALFQAGWMFWLCRNRLSGSWRRLVSTSRS